MKILIISHNPLSDQSNMGKTLSSLFSAFAPEELCQLYIYPTIPNAKRCSSFFRITDKEALKAVFTKSCPGGEVKRIDSSAGMYETAADVHLYTNRRNHSAFRKLLRDEIWRRSGWYSRNLKDWLASQKPEVVFVAPGGAKFLYDFALKIADTAHIPLVTYLCDEHYFLSRPQGLLDRWQQQRLKRKMEALLAKTAHLVTISRELATPYKETFSIPTTVLMTGAAIHRASSAKIPKEPDTISYFGNIRCQRYQALGDIGQELDAINQAQGSRYRLKIYTAEQDGTILSALQTCKSVELAGFLSGDAFTAAFGHAQLLLHVESFDPQSAEQVKHSVSTKIADSLASGIPLLAYGPEQVASMAHLRRNDCAIGAYSRETLRKALLTAFTDPETCKRAAENALLAASIYHDAAAVSCKLRNIFEGCL